MAKAKKGVFTVGKLLIFSQIGGSTNAYRLQAASEQGFFGLFGLSFRGGCR
jgi:hypothetical protein